MLWKGTQVPRGLGNIRKKTKKKPWKGQSRSRRFSFHKYFTTFFFLFLFNHFTLSFFSISFSPSTFTHTHDPRPLPTTFDPRHLATLKQYLSLNRYFVFHLAGQLRTWISNDKCRYCIQGSHKELNTNKGKTPQKIAYRMAHICYIIHRAIIWMSFRNNKGAKKDNNARLAKLEKRLSFDGLRKFGTCRPSESFQNMFTWSKRSYRNASEKTVDEKTLPQSSG